MSRMIAIRLSVLPSNVSVRSRVLPSWPWIRRSTSRGSAVIGIAAGPP